MDVLFFGVATLRFASDKEDTQPKKGYSKDGKPHRVQEWCSCILRWNARKDGDCKKRQANALNTTSAIV